ncbi:MBL fold metallo-hydrolase [Nocardioides sp. KIGAM211]|uniref:MBL fold metallo-hydrolase n=1 Tax=Nocardioides luti TaxID=2761101 RepID=A0A7X0RH54_9ACTN|nr:MBL fold metallo-hydrolase [Nocardioides luti]MBB6628231.1 MBL fold metallo-hydrolase [Nocardioides luti]
MCGAHVHEAAEPTPTGAGPRLAPTRRTALLGALGIGGGIVASSALAGVSASAAPAYAVKTGAADATGDRVVMLGVNGGPKINAGQAKPALALVVNGRTYLVDCGYDTPNQLVKSGLGFTTVDQVFITHHHLDHTSGLPGLMLHGWTDPKPLPSKIGVWGPPSTTRMLEGIDAAFGRDIRLFEKGGGFGTRPVVKGHDVRLAEHRTITKVMEDENVVVHATRVSHGPEVRNAYAYRFTIKSSGKRVVFSGDTAAPDANLIALAHQCDLLVHEAQDNDLIPVLLQFVAADQRDALREHLLVSHSNVIDLPGVAQAAGAKSLAFCHYTPLPQPASVFLGKAQQAASQIGYTGSIVAPVDLDVITL